MTSAALFASPIHQIPFDSRHFDPPEPTTSSSTLHTTHDTPSNHDDPTPTPSDTTEQIVTTTPEHEDRNLAAANRTVSSNPLLNSLRLSLRRKSSRPDTLACAADRLRNAEPISSARSSSIGSRADYVAIPPPTLIVTDSDPFPLATDKVDSKPRSGVLSVKSRAQSRLAALGRTRLRGLVPLGDYASSQGEAQPVRAPVSPSDGSSHYKASDVSSNSKSSSETSLTDGSKSPRDRFDGNPEGWQEKEVDSYSDIEEYERVLQRSPRMMHQTSSKLLRMTEEDRPFTRVSGHHRVMLSTLI